MVCCCCWGSDISNDDLREKLIDEAFQDSEVATTSATLLNSLVLVVWPTLLSPLVMKELTAAPFDLGKKAKGYQLRISNGTLSNLKIDCTHVGVVTTTEVSKKPYYERNVRTWTSRDVRLWLTAGETGNRARWVMIGEMMEENHFNGTNLLACTAQELQDEFNCTPEESFDIIRSRDKFMPSIADIAELIVQKRGGRAVQPVKKQNGMPSMNKVSIAIMHAEELKDQGYTDLCNAAAIDLHFKLSGTPSMKILLENHQNMLPNIEADIRTVNLNAKIRLEIDPTNEEIRLGFFKKPHIDLDLDIDLTNIHIPLFGESRWLDDIVEFILERKTPSKPIKIPLKIDPPGGDVTKMEKLSVAAKRSSHQGASQTLNVL